MWRPPHLTVATASLNCGDRLTISRNCTFGFEHAPNFYSAFKKMHGIMPTDYRRGVGN